MRKLYFFIILALLFGYQARAQFFFASNPEGWPEGITYERLDTTNWMKYVGQSYGGGNPEYFFDSIKVERAFYMTTGPTGHGNMGTTVYYYPSKNEFWFHSSCGMGHGDGMIGPFKGDPRVILRK